MTEKEIIERASDWVIADIMNNYNFEWPYYETLELFYSVRCTIEVREVAKSLGFISNILRDYKSKQTRKES